MTRVNQSTIFGPFTIPSVSLMYSQHPSQAPPSPGARHDRNTEPAMKKYDRNLPDRSVTDLLLSALSGLCPTALRLETLLDRIEVRT